MTITEIVIRISICAIFILLAAIAEAKMDNLQFYYNKPDKFWNPNLSWANKWKVTYNKGLQVVLVGTERFWLSSSLLVFLTDGWHLMKWIRNQSLLVAAWALCPNIYVATLMLVLRLLYAIVFHLTYNKLK